MVGKLILGFAGTALSIPVNNARTIRAETVQKLNAEKRGSGFAYARELFLKNIADIIRIVKWMAQVGGLRFFRINSNLAPHITNPEFIRDDRDPWALAYDLEEFGPIFIRLGRLARKNRIRLTFHPDPFNVLNSPNPEVVLRTTRELIFHARIAEWINADTCIIMHVGGVYDNKEVAIQRWITRFRELPEIVQRRIVLENDEFSYDIEDVLRISGECGVPVVFDLFHHSVMRRGRDRIASPSHDKSTRRGRVATLEDSESARRGRDKPAHDAGSRLGPASDYYDRVYATWNKPWLGQMKLHLSEQRPDSVIGAHSDYVRSIPRSLIAFQKKKGTDIYLMIEAKMKDQAVIRLIRKYKLN